MSNSQGTSNRPPTLFDKIDALCAEIDDAAWDQAVNSPPTLDDAPAVREARKIARRQEAYAELLSCEVVDINIKLLNVSRERASLVICSSAGLFSEYMEVAECYGLVEFLSTRGFSILATGKLLIAARDKRDDDKQETWFIMGKVKNRPTRLMQPTQKAARLISCVRVQ